jgi:hypothetical protein
VELPDQPGALAKVATVISDLDGDVVSIDIHELDGHQAVDELVVEVLTELDGRVLATALEEAKAGVLLSCAPATARAEPVSGARWARVGRTSDVCRILASACHSSKVWVAPIDEARGACRPARVGPGRTARAAFARSAGAARRKPASPMWLLAVPTVSRRRSMRSPARFIASPRRSRAGRHAHGHRTLARHRPEHHGLGSEVAAARATRPPVDSPTRLTSGGNRCIEVVCDRAVSANA